MARAQRGAGAQPARRSAPDSGASPRSRSCCTPAPTPHRASRREGPEHPPRPPPSRRSGRPRSPSSLSAAIQLFEPGVAREKLGATCHDLRREDMRVKVNDAAHPTSPRGLLMRRARFSAATQVVRRHFSYDTVDAANVPRGPWVAGAASASPVRYNGRWKLHRSTSRTPPMRKAARIPDAVVERHRRTRPAPHAAGQAAKGAGW